MRKGARIMYLMTTPPAHTDDTDMPAFTAYAKANPSELAEFYRILGREHNASTTAYEYSTYELGTEGSRVLEYGRHSIYACNDFERWRTVIDVRDLLAGMAN